MSENQQKNDIKSIDGQLLNRGCTLGTTYNTGQKVLSCGRCKLSQFDWLKDYENQEVKGNVCLAEVRFKNDRRTILLIQKTWNWNWVNLWLLKPPSDTI